MSLQPGTSISQSLVFTIERFYCESSWQLQLAQPELMHCMGPLARLFLLNADDIHPTQQKYLMLAPSSNKIKSSSHTYLQKNVINKSNKTFFYRVIDSETHKPFYSLSIHPPTLCKNPWIAPYMKNHLSVTQHLQQEEAP